MIDADQMLALLELGGEQRSVEFKRAGNIKEKPYVAKVARAAIALANYRGGGTVVLGVDDVDPIGGENGLTDGQLKDWTNVDLVNSKLNAYADPAIELTLGTVPHPNGKQLVVIQVQEFRDYPVMCKRDFGDVLFAGQLFTRSAAKPESSPRQTHGEIREVIELAVDKNLNRFLQRARGGGLTFSEDGLQLVPELYKLQLGGAFKQNSKLVTGPHFRFIIRPEPFLADRLELSALRRMVTREEVRHWGWSFPVLNSAGQGQDWVAAASEGGVDKEAWRYFRSGLFASSVKMSSGERDRRLELQVEEVVAGYLPIHVPVILFSMVLEFAARLMSRYAIERNDRAKADVALGDMAGVSPLQFSVSIEAHGIENWALSSADPHRDPGGFWRLYKYSDDVLQLDEISLRPGTTVQDTRPVALTAATAFFQHFGWVGVTPPMLEAIQREVIGD